MDHVNVCFDGMGERWRGRDIVIGCTSCSKHGHRHETQCLGVAETPSLDFIVATDGNQAGTMFQTTFDISLPWL